MIHLHLVREKCTSWIGRVYARNSMCTTVIAVDIFATRHKHLNICWLPPICHHPGHYSVLLLWSAVPASCRRKYLNIRQTIHVATIYALVKPGAWGGVHVSTPHVFRATTSLPYALYDNFAARMLLDPKSMSSADH